MGGDSGGNDCVHVIDVRAESFRELYDGNGTPVLPHRDTDVIIADEHGNVCQFTYAEWDAFAVKMKRDEFDHIGLDATLPERRCPDDRKHGAHVWEWGNDQTGRTNYRCGGWRKLPGGYGCDTCQSDDGCAECRAPSAPDPFDQPPGRPSLPGPFVNEPLMWREDVTE